MFFSKYFTSESLLIFELLLLTLPLKIAAAVIGQGHTSPTGNANISMWTMIPAGIANLVLDIIFISKYGFIGVVYSTLIVYTFANLSLIIIYNLKLRRMMMKW
jgi:Na+-driven multidrug efflux pump